MNKSNPIIMGKGDRKTRRGKIILGTYGARRRRKKIKKADSIQLQSVKEMDTRGRRIVRGKKTESETARVGEETVVLNDKEMSEEKQSVKQEVKKARVVKAEKDEKEDREAKADKKIKEAEEEKASAGIKVHKEEKAIEEMKAEKDEKFSAGAEAEKEKALEERSEKGTKKAVAAEKVAKSEESGKAS